MVRAVPRASKSEIVGCHVGRLKVRLAAPPVDGAANAELVKVLAKFFKVSKSSVEIVSGETSKNKQVKIQGANADKLKQI
jgi:uncharacterized protein (TIGR00251 family)